MLGQYIIILECGIIFAAAAIGSKADAVKHNKTKSEGKNFRQNGLSGAF